jgi:hypothetical protein
VEFGTVKCCFEFWKSSHSYGDAAILQFPACEIFPSTASSQIGSLKKLWIIRMDLGVSITLMYGQCQAVNELPNANVHASLMCRFDTFSRVLGINVVSQNCSFCIKWHNDYLV